MGEFEFEAMHTRATGIANFLCLHCRHTLKCFYPHECELYRKVRDLIEEYGG